MVSTATPRHRAGPAYDDASLRALPGTVLTTSADAGWRSALIERTHWPAGHASVETRASPDLRISMVLRGAHRVDVLSNGRWLGSEATPGDVAVTGAGEVNRLRLQSEVSIETVHLFVPVETVASAAEQLRRAGTRLSTAVPASAFADPAVSTVLESLLSAVRLGAPDLYAAQTVHWLAMHLLLTQRLAGMVDIGGRAERLTDRRLARVIALIEQQYAAPLSLDRLAAEACVSKFQFARLFRLKTGTSPHAYLLAERMKAARDLLAATDLPVAEIARRTGFARSTHFAVAFRQAHRMTATEFRHLRHPRRAGKAPQPRARDT